MRWRIQKKKIYQAKIKNNKNGTEQEKIKLVNICLKKEKKKLHRCVRSGVTISL